MPDKSSHKNVLELMPRELTGGLNFVVTHIDIKPTINGFRERRLTERPRSSKAILQSDVVATFDRYLIVDDEEKKRLPYEFNRMSEAYVRNRDLVEGLIGEYFSKNGHGTNAKVDRTMDFIEALKSAGTPSTDIFCSI